MPTFAELLQAGTAHAWLFIPSAIVLGALHGLEPGHSKTMMAAFIVAIRGTVTQAVLLGLPATASHTLVVWVIALGGMYLWRDVDAERLEPYFQLASAIIIIGIAAWMLWRVGRDRRHPHGGDARRIDTGHGVIAVEIFEDGVPPRFRVRGQGWAAHDVTLETTRPDGGRQVFAFADRGGYLEAIDEIAEPHDFTARLSLRHGGHSHDYDLTFAERLDVATDGHQDAHQRAHADEIRTRFADRDITTGQIVMFGLTGGLIPCPAAITVLLLCLQLKEIPLGFALVLCFSIGLAITLVAVGAAAALSVRQAARRWSWFDTLARRAPYISGLLIIAVGLYVGYQGWRGLTG